ncbi:uncharacterized protein K452DRAFT_314318 [Aplosporella prunicola CBS 121167]|uniref:Uncharacterized protein n=1 Tax=Aplosporella prunicola CBS 121167 TaxID=1176127 RepID=A0A6A6BSK9_9PEZI|nr:uncharacterized protein K452DRAFT_314318 [Aplosporella prunicola CBS 121167]KAF2147089.1 hypothetical protein K452DRAFT_314318 [Aplosporella prunicola CBS 121167]
MAFSFAHSVSRPFPWRYLTPSLIIFFILATVFLSFFTAVVDGYELRLTYTTNPNGTMAKKMWYDKPLFAMVTKRFTQTNSVSLTLNNIETTNHTILTSLTYHNNTLKDCYIHSIKMNFDSESESAGIEPFAPKLLGGVTCSISNGLNNFLFNLTVEYNINVSQFYEGTYGRHLTQEQHNDVGVYRKFVRSNSPDAAMWWAESLMVAYSIHAFSSQTNLSNRMANLTAIKVGKSTLNYQPSSVVTDLKDDRFFNTNIWFTDKESRLYMWDEWAKSSETLSGPVSNLTLAEMKETARVNDMLAKAFYSTILVDLGNKDKPNVIADEQLLQRYTRKLGTYGPSTELLGRLSLANDSYNALKHIRGRPTIKPSTIFSGYLCQIPTRKSTSSFMIAVLLADLVILRALWTIITFTATLIAEKKDPQENWCIGCAAAAAAANSTRYPLPLYSPPSHQINNTQQPEKQPLRWWKRHAKPSQSRTGNSATEHGGDIQPWASASDEGTLAPTPLARAARLLVTDGRVGDGGLRFVTRHTW